MAIATRLLTPQDVLDMLNRGDLCTDQPFELVDGELVWLSRSKFRESRVCVRILRAIAAFADSIEAELLESSAGFMVGEGLRQLRGPDVALVTRERVHLLDPDGWMAGAPDLAVEVLSEGEYGETYTKRKVPEYLAAGAKVVWLADPRKLTIREYMPGRSEFLTYAADDTITLDAIAPGFSAVVGSLFPAN